MARLATTLTDDPSLNTILPLNKLIRSWRQGNDAEPLRERQHDVEDGATILTQKLSNGLTVNVLIR